jgi:hypothetical protein
MRKGNKVILTFLPSRHEDPLVRPLVHRSTLFYLQSSTDNTTFAKK